MSPRRSFAAQDRFLELQPGGDLLAHRVHPQGGFHPHRVRRRVLPMAFGEIVTAVIGGQHHGIVDAGRVELLEEGAELAVEGEHLQAHLRPFCSVGVTDVIGRR